MTAPPPTAALTPEELAARIELVGTEAAQEEIREDIAAAIRQHSEAQRAEIERLTKENEALGYDASMTRTLRDKAGKVCGAAQRLVYEMRNHVPSDAALPHASLELQAIRRAYDALSATLEPQETADVR